MSKVSFLFGLSLFFVFMFAFSAVAQEALPIGEPQSCCKEGSLSCSVDVTKGEPCDYPASWDGLVVPGNLWMRTVAEGNADHNWP